MCRFSDRLQKLLKSSLTLQHLDISCMHLDESQIRIFVLRGVCKSKSLISLHMSENHLSAESLYFIRETLKISFEDCKENDKMQHVHALLGQEAHHDEIKELKFNTYEVRTKLRLHEDLLKPLVEFNPADRYAFTRVLGAQEIVDGYKWQQVDDRECYVCRRDAYCLFFWSESLVDAGLLKTTDTLPGDVEKQFAR